MNKSSKYSTQKTEMLIHALNFAPQHGWDNAIIDELRKKYGYTKVEEFFPKGLESLTDSFADWADAQMLQRIENNPDFTELKVREKIAFAVQARLQSLIPYKPAFCASVKYMLHPLRAPRTKKMTWTTANIIWKAAGDRTTDYNHYTKRLLLSGVLGSTSLFFLNDKSENHCKTWIFLERRIDNVLQFGKFMSKLKRSA